MKRSRMWTTIHPYEDFVGTKMWLIATDGSERLYAVIEVDPKDELCFLGTRCSDGKRFYVRGVFGLMNTLFIATIGDVGVEIMEPWKQEELL